MLTGLVLALFVILFVAVVTLIRLSFAPAKAPAGHPTPTVASRQG